MAIVFIHAGYSPYLEFSLGQARTASPESDIFLLGDASNNRFPAHRFPFVHHIDTGAAVFDGAGIGAAYQHLSTNPEPFERACFDRWFLLDTFLATQSLGSVLVLDSDVMLYATEAEIRRTHVGTADVALSRPDVAGPFAWAASPHVSFWTAEALRDFCADARASYTDPARFALYDAKWGYHVKQGLGGGICDMTALHLFAEARTGVANVADVHGGAAVDHNVNVADNAFEGEYRMDGMGKAVSWADGYPMGDNLRLGMPVRFYALHCQGHAKGRMPALYRGPAFDGQRRASRAVRTRNGARRWASVIVQPVRRLRSRLAG
ncbi:MAG TPA: hypothetical protein VGB53_10120 [Rubricoccaceae bacterium]|jgi:hypothetical protein